MVRKSIAILTLSISAMLWTIPARSDAIMLRFESIEWLTQSSERVIVAKVVKVDWGYKHDC